MADAHEMACKLHPTPYEIGVRRQPKSLFERAGEVGITALHDVAQIGDQYPGGNVGVDVFAHTTRLP
jgi:hypothetical protein